MSRLDIRSAHGLTVPKAKAPTTETFTASGTWTKPVGAVRVTVHCIGAGGGAHSGFSYANGGGGGEGILRTYNATDLPASVAVTVGAGGAGIVGVENSFTAGHGGDSSFGSFITARGGNGAYEASTVSTSPTPGTGGGWRAMWQRGNLANRGVTPTPSDAVTYFGATLPSDVEETSGGTGAASGNNTNTGTSSRFGGGGGGAWSSGYTSYNGGASVHAGAGGSPSSVSTAANNGVVPGGGGAGYQSTNDYAGSGARGEVRVTTYYA